MRLTVGLLSGMALSSACGGAASPPPTPGGELPPPSSLPMGLSLALEGCREHPSFAQLRKALGVGRDDPQWQPEWRAGGFMIDILPSNRVSLAWADGYTDADMEAEQPIPRPWVDCTLPGVFTRGISSVSYGASVVWQYGLLDLQIIDEGVSSDPWGPRYEFQVVVDLTKRQALPRVLCLAATARAAPDDPAPCELERPCDVLRSAGHLQVGLWTARGSTPCASLLERFAEDDIASGLWSFRD